MFRLSANFQAFTIDTIPGKLPPFEDGFDPLGFAEKADEPTLKRYREAELTHGRVAMLAVVGFLVGEAVEGSSFLFDASISGPAITHIPQVPVPFWGALAVAIGGLEIRRAEKGFVGMHNFDLAVAAFCVLSHFLTYCCHSLIVCLLVFPDPAEIPVDQPGLLRSTYTPGDLGFDPLGLMPSDPDEFAELQTKELQNGRLAMLAAAGFLAQEAVDGKGIIEHLTS